MKTLLGAASCSLKHAYGNARYVSIPHLFRGAVLAGVGPATRWTHWGCVLEKRLLSHVLLGPSFLAAEVQVSLEALLNSHLILSFLHLSIKLAFDTLRREPHHAGQVAL